jgi:hypothetical protein
MKYIQLSQDESFRGLTPRGNLKCHSLTEPDNSTTQQREIADTGKVFTIKDLETENIEEKDNNVATFRGRWQAQYSKT